MQYFYYILSIILYLLIFPYWLVLCIKDITRAIIARLCGAKVHTFVIGSGHEIVAFHLTKMRFSIRLIPLTAYPQIDNPPDYHFYNLNYWKKCIITFAGPFALLIMTIFLGTIWIKLSEQTNYSQEPIIGFVYSQSPADKEGLLKDDLIININEDEIQEWGKIVDKVASSEGKDLDFQLIRNSKKLNIRIKPELNEFSNTYMIGIRPRLDKFTYSFKDALTFSSKFTYRIPFNLYGAELESDLKNSPVVINDNIPNNESSLKAFLKSYLFTSYLFSAYLLFLTLIPIPYLTDSGHFLYYSFEALKGSPIHKNYTIWSNRLIIILPSLLLLFSIFLYITRFIY